jgi:hypothetical protein
MPEQFFLFYKMNLNFDFGNKKRDVIIIVIKKGNFYFVKSFIFFSFRLIEQFGCKKSVLPNGIFDTNTNSTNLFFFLMRKNVLKGR